jgi:hypothetical protein
MKRSACGISPFATSSLVASSADIGNPAASADALIAAQQSG